MIHTAITIPVWLIGLVFSFILLMIPRDIFYWFSTARKTISAFSGGSVKQVFLVRSDLKMGQGKVAAQCAHAAVKSYKDMSKKAEYQKILQTWELTGTMKVVLKVPDEASMVTIAEKARNAGIHVSTIRDAGHTQVAPGSMTVTALGPAPVAEIDAISGDLKLL